MPIDVTVTISDKRLLALTVIANQGLAPHDQPIDGVTSFFHQVEALLQGVEQRYQSLIAKDLESRFLAVPADRQGEVLSAINALLQQPQE